MKQPKPPTPAHTISALSEITGHDRRTLKRRLVNTAPARIDGKHKLYTVEAALNAVGEATPARAKNEPLQGCRDHYLYRLVRECMLAGSHLHAALQAHEAAIEYLAAVHASAADDPRRAQITDELNMEGYGTRRPLHELVFGKDGHGIGEDITAALKAAEIVNQRAMELDATLQLTGFFSTPEGRAQSSRVRAANTPGK